LSPVGQPEAPPFLIIRRQLLQARYPSGEQSQPFAYDSVGRRALDAVVIAAWELVEGEVCVYLRSGVRPPLLERAAHPAAGDRFADPGLWELPAGLIEPDDFAQAGGREEGVSVAASRELREELGFDIAPTEFRALGHGTFPSPAMTAEKQFFVCVNVSGQPRQAPVLDGSPLEEHAAIVIMPLSCALEQCRDGVITDAKTELGLRRLTSLDAVKAGTGRDSCGE
jgi:ADP-ribose pyrophosphatase